MLKSKKIKKEKQPKIKNPLLKRIGRFLLRFVLIILFVFIIFTSTFIVLSFNAGFRRWSSKELLDIVNSQLEGKIEFSDYKYQFPNQIDLYNVRLLAAGDTLAYIQHLHLHFVINRLFAQKVLVRNLILDNPRIKILRSMTDSTWNVEHIAKPSGDTTTKPLPNWVIKVENLKINHSEFFMIDSTTADFSAKYFATNNIHLNDFNLSLSSNVELAKQSFMANIDTISFNELNSGLKLKPSSIIAALDKKHIQLTNTKIALGESNININYKLDSVNIFGNKEESDLKRGILNLKINADKLNTEEFSKIASLPIKINGNFSLNSEIIGKLNNLDIKSFLLKNNSTNINLNGNVKNLLISDSINYHVNINQINATYSHLKKILPDIDFRSIPDFGNLILSKTWIDGNPDSISAEIQLNSRLGKIIGPLGFGMKGDIKTYSASLDFTSINLGPILHGDSLKSMLNGKLILSGMGTNLDELKSNLNLNIKDSYYNNIDIIELKSALSINNRKIDIDTLSALFRELQNQDNGIITPTSKIFANGWLNLQNEKIPSYKLDVLFNSLNLAKLLKTGFTPRNISGKLEIEAEGFNPDSISGNLSLSVEECVFGDRELFPFNTNIHIKRFNKDSRMINIYSDYITAELYGKFNFSTLFSTVANQGVYLGEYVASKFNFIGNDSQKRINLPENNKKIESFAPIDLNFRASIKDLTVISTIVDNFDIFSKADIELKIKSDAKHSQITIDSVSVSTFKLAIPDFRLQTSPLIFYGGFDLSINDSLPRLDRLDLNVKAKSDININSLILNSPEADIKFKNDIAEIYVNSGINNFLKINSNGKINFNDKSINLVLDTAKLNYNGSYNWVSTKPLSVIYNSKGFNITQCQFERKNAESISISGLYNINTAENLKINVKGLPTKDIMKFIPENQKQYIKSLGGKIDSLEANLNGKFENPDIKFNLHGSDLVVNGTYIGNLSSELEHKNAIVTGFLDIINKKIPTNNNTISVDINSLPLDLALMSVKERLHRRFPINLNITSDGIPLEIVSPFVPGITNLTGNANANILVEGKSIDEIDYHGKLDFNNSSLIVQSTNVKYLAEGSCDVEKDKVTIKNVALRNMRRDTPDGLANITGTVKLDNFNIDSLDIKVETQQLLVLSSASMKTMPTLYGDFVISSGENPIHFYGTLLEPNLDGDINVLKADLKMPKEIESQKVSSALTYVIKDNKLFIYDSSSTQPINIITSDSAKTQSPIKKEVQERSMADLINYNLSIKILGRLDVNMEIFTLSQLKALIGTPDRNIPIRYVKNRDSKRATLYGQLVVKKGSSFEYFKKFDTEGEISFPTGSMENPGVNLVARNSFRTSNKNETKNYVVSLYITGTKNNPNIRFAYTINGEQATGDSTQISEDALFLILTGKTKADLTNSGSPIMSALPTKEFGTLGASLGASYLLTQMLSGAGIESANIDFNEGNVNIDQARFKLTGKLFGDVRWEIGGTVADIASNNEISIDVPLTSLLKANLLNMNFQLTHSSNISTTPSLDQKVWEIKFKLGGSW
jgi:hypothetical protein